MRKHELEELLANGENSGIEFKRDDGRPEQLAKEIVALANPRGGRILLGVEDDGHVSGPQQTRGKMSIAPEPVDYHQDFYGWIERNVALLRRGRLTEIDVEHIAEELESMGKRDLRQLRSRLQVLVAHLLKWAYQPERQSKSWLATIDHQRDEIEALLLDSPSLRPLLHAALEQVYPKAVRDAARETSLTDTHFPSDCPYDVEDILRDGFLPGD